MKSLWFHRFSRPIFRLSDRASDRHRGRLHRCLVAAAVIAGSAVSGAEVEWRRISQIEVTEGAQPRALGFDESGAAYWLESQLGVDGGSLGRIRRQAAEPMPESTVLVDEIALKPGRCSIFAWRGRCYLAAPPAIRIIEKGRDGGPATIKVLDPNFEIEPSQDAAGFGGLTIAPDGRIYGSFSGGTVSGIEDAPGNQSAVFCFEPDGSGFAIAHRGLLRPSAPVFDDMGRSRLIDRAEGPNPAARWMRLLDGGFGRGGEAIPTAGLVQPEAAALGGFGRNGCWVFWLTCKPDGGPPQLAWHPCGDSKEKDAAPDPASLLEGARIIDLASDWNGIPHLLISRGAEDAGTKTIEILAFGKPEDRAKAAAKLATISEQYDDPTQGDGTDLLDLLNDPERRIRWQAAWALTRRKNGLPLLMHVLGRGEVLSHRAALAAIGIIARRGAGAAVPGDDQEFAPMPRDQLARQAAEATGGLLDHPDPEVRVQALRILGAGRQAAGLIPFSTMLADPDPTVRDEALLAAARLRWRALISSLNTARSRGGGKLNTARLADVLDAVHPPEQLPVYGQQSDQQLRLAAVEALRRRSHAALGSFVFDSEPEVAAAAVIAIDERQVSSCFGTVATRLSRDSIDDWPLAARQAAERCVIAAKQ